MAGLEIRPMQQWLDTLLYYAERAPSQSRVRRTALATLFVAAAFALRLAIDPLIGGTFDLFWSFYAAVVLTAALCGLTEALIATVASAVLSYWAFAAPHWAFGMNPTALSITATFMLIAAANAIFLSVIVKRLVEHREAREAAEAASLGHAEMFRTFNDRTTNHLQLVASILNAGSAHQSATAQEALEHASRQTMLISRLHRTMGSDTTVETDITLLGRQLLQAHRTERSSAMQLDLAQDAVLVSPDQASSIATILIEMVKAFDNAGAAGLRFRVSEDVDRVDVLLEGSSLVGTLSSLPLAPTAQVLVNGSVEELRAQFSIERYIDGVAMRLVIPRGGVTMQMLQQPVAQVSRAVTRH